MVVDVRTINFTSTPTLLDYARTRLDLALDRFAPRIQHARVCLSNGNSSHAGKDMACVMRIDLGRDGHVVVEQHDSDIYAAIDRAAGRTKRTVRRKINRRRLH